MSDHNDAIEAAANGSCEKCGGDCAPDRCNYDHMAVADAPVAEAALRSALEKLSPIPLWRDTYPDGPDIFCTALDAYLTPADVRTIRQFLSASPAPQNPEPSAKEVAAWMIAHSYPTGHGDTLDALLSELVEQAKRLTTALTRSPSVERVADEIDAKRYRYLRNRPENTIGKGGIFAGSTPPTGSGGMILTEDDLDRAVDAAIAASPQPEGK